MRIHLIEHTATKYLEILTHHTLTNAGGAQYDSSSSCNQEVKQWSKRIFTCFISGLVENYDRKVILDFLP